MEDAHIFHPRQQKAVKAEQHSVQQTLSKYTNQMRLSLLYVLVAYNLTIAQ